MYSNRICIFLNLFCLFFSLTLKHSCYADHRLSNHLQLLVVTSNSWEDKKGTLQCFERANKDEKWTAVKTPKSVVLGELGMAWGRGLYQLNDRSIPFSKIEGDLKSPAGIFSLGYIFGFLPKSQMTHLKMDYLQLNDFMEAVDDPLSGFYNCIVDSREVLPDWKSSEKMRKEPLYEMGLLIHHNLPQPQPGKGSAIFLHKWRTNNMGTAGCTAMSRDDLEQVLSWLEKSKNPALVQLPYPVYSQLLSTWNLPSLAKEQSQIENFNLVNISNVNSNIILDIRYATNNNFLGFPVYSKPVCFLHKEVAEALNRVQAELSLIQLGLKVFDGYRPLSVQQIMWDTVQDERYVSNPAKNKGRHTRGTAIDLTLVDSDGRELEMPTGFDDFTEKAHSDCSDVSEVAAYHRKLLRDIMAKHGFQVLPTEWWHFDFKGWNDDVKFPPLDVSFEYLK